MNLIKKYALIVLTKWISSLKYKLYKYENTDIDIIKNDIFETINNKYNENKSFYYNAYKLKIIMDINLFKCCYSKYSLEFNELQEILQIKDNDIFNVKFKNKINGYDDLFLLFLLLISCEERI